MKPKIQIDLDHAVPQFAKTRVEDFLNAWNPNFMPFKDFATSLYLQGLSDGFAVGEGFTTSRLRTEKQK